MLSCCCAVGSLWQPNISLAQITAASGRSALAVSFNPDRFAEKYKVFVKCSAIKQEHHAYSVRSHAAHSNDSVFEEWVCSRLSLTEEECSFLFSDLTQNITVCAHYSSLCFVP